MLSGVVLAKNVTGTNGRNDSMAPRRRTRSVGSVVQTISMVGKPLMNSTAAVARQGARQTRPRL